MTKPSLPTDAETRKDIPLARGLLDYFPAALAEVAHLSKVANDQHNPGEPLHHARGKSTDHADCLLRHLVDRGTRDTDGLLHSAKVAWRALALLQEELEAAGAPMARGAKVAESEPPTGEDTVSNAFCDKVFFNYGDQCWFCELEPDHPGKHAAPSISEYEAI